MACPRVYNRGLCRIPSPTLINLNARNIVAPMPDRCSLLSPADYDVEDLELTKRQDRCAVYFKSG